MWFSNFKFTAVYHAQVLSLENTHTQLYLYAIYIVYHNHQTVYTTDKEQKHL